MYIKIKHSLLVLALLFIYNKSFSQEKYHKDGNMYSVDELVKDFYIIDTLIKIDNQIKILNKRDVDQKLQLLLIKAKVYLDNYETESALRILLSLLDEINPKKNPKILTEVYLQLARLYNQTLELKEFKRYTDITEKYIEQYHFDDLKGMLYYLKSGYYRIQNQIDSTLIYSDSTLKYAKIYNNDQDCAYGYTMKGVALGRTDSATAIQNFEIAIEYNNKLKNYTYIAIMYYNIARQHYNSKNYEKSKLYIDSAFLYYDDMNYYYKENLPVFSYELYKTLEVYDTSLYYLEMAYNDAFKSQYFLNISKGNEYKEKYENAKNTESIKKRNLLITFLTILSVFIIIVSFLIFRLYKKIKEQNHKISSQNLIIQDQLEHLQKLLNQKQVLLSELQHRVKNNLQQVISILEIQKESIDYSNIVELVRQNQNRIHSMALIHKKLNIDENINSIHFDHYIHELSELVASSYIETSKNIRFDIQSHLGNTNIETALPLGLIIVELISNSLKHAFTEQNDGLISIKIFRNHDLEKNLLIYSDNGKGFDFKPKMKKGLGIEIVQGLIDQINGKYTVSNSEGFQITVTF